MKGLQVGMSIKIANADCTCLGDASHKCQVTIWHVIDTSKQTKVCSFALRPSVRRLW